MTVAPHPISQNRSLSLPAARRSRTAMSSQALAEPLRASTRGQAAHLHDRTSSPSSFRDPQIPIGRALQCLPPRGFLLGRLSDAGPGASPPPSQWAGVQNPSPFEASSTAVRYVRFTSIVSKNSDFRSITFLISRRDDEKWSGVRGVGYDSHLGDFEQVRRWADEEFPNRALRPAPLGETSIFDRTPMRRRDLFALLAGAALPWPLAARAGQTELDEAGRLHWADPVRR